VLCDGSWNGLLRVAPYWDAQASQTTGQSSGELVVNGDFETASMVPWQRWPTGFTASFEGGIGPTPHSWIANSDGSGAFMLQSILIPQEAWNSVDAGAATLNFSCNQFGSSKASPAVTFFDAHFTQLGQSGYQLQSIGWSAWASRSLSAEPIPVGTRMFFVQLHASGTHGLFDNVSCDISW